jgi:hypothetical protein
MGQATGSMIKPARTARRVSDGHDSNNKDVRQGHFRRGR